MLNISLSRGTKRKMDDETSEPPSTSSKATLLSQSLLLLEIPADTNTSLPVWEAVRSQQLDVAWAVSPYSITVHLTPVTSKGKTTTSSKGERTSRATQTSAASTSVQQLCTVTQSVAQQHSSPQNASYVLLTFPQNAIQSQSGLPLKTPLNPSSATPLIVSLPLIITQPQPSVQPCTPTKKAALPAIQSPTATPTKLQAPSKVPVPSPFHTKSSSEVRICDDFLLRLCLAGRRCKMHHTPYPFHWQLWCVSRHQWVNFPPRSQVLLERLYSNVNKNSICIKDGQIHYYLAFDTMELDGSTKYDGVRRLTNSDRNPYFPSRWKLYWWNNFNWEEYNKTVSALLLKKMSEKEPECSFHIGSQEYKIDFTTMIQTNVTTGFPRDVRCRPAYRSLESMLPYLRTEIQTDHAEPLGDPPGPNFSVDPLEEFSSWYPPVWCLPSELDYSLVGVPAGTQAYKRVKSFFHESLPETEVDIISIQQVQNFLYWDKYQRHKVHMLKQHIKSTEPLERHLFHGTTKQASEDICHNNFDPRMAGANGTSYGHGSYFAIRASYSNSYSAAVAPDDIRHMFLAKVLVGNVSVGRNNYRRPPPLSSKTSEYHLYDTCVDRMNKPTLFVVFDSCQCYPYYLIKYKDLPKEVEI